MSPKRTDGAPAKHLGDAMTRPAGRILGERTRREKAVRDDFTIRLRRRGLLECAHDIERNMITPGNAPVEIDREQSRRAAQFDIALLAQLARECARQGFVDFDAAARWASRARPATTAAARACSSRRRAGLRSA